MQDINPTKSIDLENPLSHSGLCFHSICAGHNLKGSWTDSRQRNTTALSQAAFEHKLYVAYDVMWFTHFRSFPMSACGGRMLIANCDGLENSLFTLVTKGLKSQTSTTDCGLPLYCQEMW